jgi:paraquat-inducible protein B
MSKSSNPTALGLFLAIGLALGIAGVLIFTSGTLFHPQQKAILYFDASLKGLDPGAAVKFRGVTIGKVEQVLIRHNQSSEDSSMPVIIAIDKKLAQSKSDQQLQIGSQARLDQAIGQGLRGRLDAESLVTGVLYVDLDMVRNPPPPVFHQLRPEYHEIPTMPSDFQQFLVTLEHLDLPDLRQKLSTLLTRLDASLTQLNMVQINADMTNLLVAAHHLVATPELTNSISAVKRTLDHAEVVLTRIGGRVDPVADNLTNTLYEAQKTIIEARRGIQNLSGLLEPDSSFHSEITEALEQIGQASRAVADLAEFLKRNPNALLMGKKRPGEEP